MSGVVVTEFKHPLGRVRAELDGNGESWTVVRLRDGGVGLPSGTVSVGCREDAERVVLEYGERVEEIRRREQSVRDLERDLAVFVRESASLRASLTEPTP